MTKELLKLEERKHVRREQEEIEKKRKAKKEREEENSEMRSMNTSMQSGSPFKIGAKSEAGSSPTKSKYSPYKNRGGDAAS